MRHAVLERGDTAGRKRRCTRHCGLLLLSMIAAAGCADRQPHAEPAETLVVSGARVYASPTAEPMDDGVVIVQDGRIVAVGPRRAHQLPPAARVIDGSGKSVTAGFWNSHVHFIEQHWAGAQLAPEADVTARLRQMLLRHGFTSVVDTGSPLHVTKALRNRIESGDVKGPRILTTGDILFPENGSPPPEVFDGLAIMRGRTLEIGSPDAAAAVTRTKLETGADAIKLYVATWWQQPAARLPLPVVQAAVAEAHRHGRPVLAHPSDLAGLETAIAGGVDIILHTTAPAGPWSAALVERLRDHDIALVPTLTLWRAELVREGIPEATAARIQQTAVGQLRVFVRAGGEVLFGTDVGYVQDDDPREEYELMAAAGMSGRQILAALTTAPARRFGGGEQAGMIVPGAIADLVMLDGDPADDPTAFGRVALVVRDGRIIYSRETLEDVGLLLRCPDSADTMASMPECRERAVQPRPSGRTP